MKNYTFIAIGAIALVIVVMFATWALLHNETERGTFGDMFGVANALFSGVVFVGVTYAIFLQREEIRIARDDIKYTKAILDEQQTQLTLQNEATKTQAFENTFFKLIDLFVSTGNLVERQLNGQTVRGRTLFQYFFDRIQTLVTMRIANREPNALVQGFDDFYSQDGFHLSHYFRTLRGALEFIDSSAVNNKEFYAGVLRDQISDAEVSVIFYFGASGRMPERMKLLVEKHAVLRNLQNKYTIDPDHRTRFHMMAFS